LSVLLSSAAPFLAVSPTLVCQSRCVSLHWCSCTHLPPLHPFTLPQIAIRKEEFSLPRFSTPPRTPSLPLYLTMVRQDHWYPSPSSRVFRYFLSCRRRQTSPFLDSLPCPSFCSAGFFPFSPSPSLVAWRGALFWFSYFRIPAGFFSALELVSPPLTVDLGCSPFYVFSLLCSSLSPFHRIAVSTLFRRADAPQVLSLPPLK